MQKIKNKKLKEEYNSKLQKEINKNKSKFETQFKEKLEFFETTLINKKLKDEKKYREEQNNLYDEKQKAKNKNLSITIGFIFLFVKSF